MEAQFLAATKAYYDAKGPLWRQESVAAYLVRVERILDEVSTGVCALFDDCFVRSLILLLNVWYRLYVVCG